MRITNFREQPKGDKNIALFDVEDYEKAGITYPNIRLKQGKNGGYWVDCPSYVKSDDGMGNKEWGKYPTFSQEVSKDFSKRVIELLKPFVEFNI